LRLARSLTISAATATAAFTAALSVLGSAGHALLLRLGIRGASPAAK
jgi:hypothetical protein